MKPKARKRKRKGCFAAALKVRPRGFEPLTFGSGDQRSIRTELRARNLDSSSDGGVRGAENVDFAFEAASSFRVASLGSDLDGHRNLSRSDVRLFLRAMSFERCRPRTDASSRRRSSGILSGSSKGDSYQDVAPASGLGEWHVVATKWIELKHADHGRA